MIEDFILRAFLAGIGISIIAGSLGSFVIWRRMSYFSESISHSALLGVALGIASGLNLHFSLVLVGALFASLIVILQAKHFLSNDAILGIFSHIALSLGIVVLTLVAAPNTDYLGFLFGDILAIGQSDIFWVYGIALVIILLLRFFYHRLLLLTLSEDLARAEGVNYLSYQLLFMLMIALAVSVSVQIVGVLLITSLLIIPPAIARVFAKTPKQMIFQSIGFAMLAVCSGIWVSIFIDIATGPLIVILLGAMFIFSQFLATKHTR